jgi:hypothetical protein
MHRVAEPDAYSVVQDSVGCNSLYEITAAGSISRGGFSATMEMPVMLE